MTKENIIEIRFNIYDGERSDILFVYTDIKFERFGYGDAFGHDGKYFWLDLNQDLEGHDATAEHRKIYRIIRGVIDSIL